MIQFSVIVPVYHVSAYLPRCVESVLVQTYPKWELILVDDGGDDECPRMCDGYAARDSRIRCIHKANAGQSMARKTALAEATGDYILFVDGDDWLSAETLQKCADCIEKTGADVIGFGYYREYAKHAFETYAFNSERFFIGDEVHAVRRRFVGLYGNELRQVESADRLSPVWGKAYRAELTKDALWVSEREVGSSEDAYFNFGTFEECYSFAYMHECLYHYRKTNEGATTRKYRARLFEQWQVLFALFAERIKEKNLGEDYEQALRNRVALGMLGLGLNELSNPKGFFRKAANLRKILRLPVWVEAYRSLEFRWFPFKWQVFFFLCKCRMTELLLLMLYGVSFLKSRVAS